MTNYNELRAKKQAQIAIEKQDAIIKATTDFAKMREAAGESRHLLKKFATKYLYATYLISNADIARIVGYKSVVSTGNSLARNFGEVRTAKRTEAFLATMKEAGFELPNLTQN